MKNKFKKLVTLTALIGALLSPAESIKSEVKQKPKAVATMYHCISNNPNGYLTIKPDLLEKQIDWLKKTISRQLLLISL